MNQPFYSLLVFLSGAIGDRDGDRDVAPLIPLFCVTVGASSQIVMEPTELHPQKAYSRGSAVRITKRYQENI